MRVRILTVLATIVFFSSLGGCGGGGGGAGVPGASGVPTITAQPSDQSVVAGTTATISVVATDATGYQWQTRTNNGSSFSDIGGATTANYTTAVTSLADNGTQYRVVVSGAGNSVTSNGATLSVNATASAPAFTTQPIDVAITEGQNAQFAVAVSGTPTPALQWQLSTDGGSSWNNINGETSPTLNVVATVLANSGRQFRAVATNSVTTANSNAATLTVTAAPAAAAAPAAPSGLVATVASSSSIGLTWADNSNNESGFKIERATGAGGPYTLITTTSANATNYSNTGLTSSTAYYYRVRATNSAGDSANTSVASATTSAPPATPPMAPSGLVATAASSSSIGLTWVDNSNNESGFKIERATGAGGPYTLITTTSANATNYSNTGLSASTAYYYRVRATNGAGDSANTAVASATTQAPAIVYTTVYLYPTVDNSVGQDSLDLAMQTTAYPAEDDLWVGCNWMYNSFLASQEYRCIQSLMKFNVAALAGKTIDSATLTLKTYHTGTGYLWPNWYIAALMSPWSDTVTWNTAASFTYDIGTSQVFNPPTYSGQVYNIGLTGVVQAWSGGWANNGLIMETTNYVFPYNTSWDMFSFYSSQTGVGWGPTLTVTYH